jgi:hypothetical protein
MANIFRDLKYMESALCEMSEGVADPMTVVRWGLYERVKSYVKSAPYSSYKNKRLFIDTYFNYIGVVNVDTIIARKLNIKQASVRLIRKRLSAEAVAMLGSDIAEKVLRGDEAVLSRLSRDLTTLEKGVAVASELFPIEVLEAIRKMTLCEEEFPLVECKKEIIFMRKFTLENIQRLMLGDELDTDKMSHIVNVLNNPRHKQYKAVLRAITSENQNNGGNL